MNVVGKVGNLISQGVYSVATPFHPFGGAVDVIVVEQEDGTYRSTPWHVRFGKFQGVLKGAEKVVGISVNDVEADFHMFLDNSGEAYFVREVDSGISTKTEPELDNNNVCSDSKVSESSLAENLDGEKDIFHGGDGDGKAKNDEQTYGFQDEHSTSEISVGSTSFTPYHYGSLDEVEDIVESSNNSKAEMVLVSVDGHVLTAPISSSDTENVQLDTPQFHLGPGDDSADEFASSEKGWVGDIMDEFNTSSHIMDEFNTSSPKTSEVHGSSSGVPDNSGVNSHHDPAFLDTPSIVKASDDIEEHSPSLERNDTFMSCVDLPELAINKDESDSQNLESPNDIHIKPKRSENSHFGKTKSNLSEVKADDGFSDDSDEVNNKSASTCVELHDTSIKVEVYERDSVIDMRTGHVKCDEFNVDSEFHRLQCIEIDRKSKEKKNIIIGDEYSVATANHSPKVNEEQEPEVKESCTAVMLPEDGKKNSESQNQDRDSSLGFEVSLCGNILHAGIGKSSAAKAFESLRVSREEFEANGPAIIKNKNLIVRYNEKYFFWDKAAPIVLGMAVYGVDLSIDPKDAIPIEQEVSKALDDAEAASPSPRRWRLFTIPFKRAKSLQPSNSSNEEELENPESILHNPETESSVQDIVNDEKLPSKQFKRTNVPNNEQIASLRLKDGQNMITFSFCTRVLGKQEVNAHIYLWKWNARIVISDVDGTITKSDVLGQFMPLVGKDWSQLGVARLFCSIKENGYQLLFLSARAIVQAYLTRSFLLNLKQDGKTLPNGPVVISPDGLFPSLYREVIRRAPHEFKIACLEDIKALFPSDHNPFYAGFGNRDTDELSYRKIGIPRGKIFIINPKGEVAINHCIDVKSYTSLHTLINDMFPPTSIAEEEDYNSWNYWKMPLPSIED